jgi:serine/threonine-protein kinase
MPTDALPAEGEMLADKYRVERVLGEGGMGRVLLAFHTGLDQRVAVKLLQPGLAQRDPTATERFKREARTSARIRHEHVCRVLDAGSLGDGTPYLAMEYLEGKDLGEELAARGRLPTAEAAGLVRQACLGVQEAHRLGIVHRDLKPQNLFLTRSESGAPLLKVLDFGISKLQSDDGPGRKLTRTSALVGSPLYMPPEQLRADKDLDGRADVWALGAILYELVTGVPPFSGESMPQLIHAVLHTEPQPFEALGIQAPGGLEAVIAKAMHKDPAQRIASARELADALVPYAPMAETILSGPRERDPVPALSAADALRKATPPAQSRSTSTTRGGHALRLATFGFFAVVGALGLAMLSRGGPAEEVPPAPPGHPLPVTMAPDTGASFAAESRDAPAAVTAAELDAAPEPAAAEPAASSAESAAAAPADAGVVPLSKTASAVRPRTVPRPAPTPAAATGASPLSHPPGLPDPPSSALPSFGGRR